MLHFEAIGSIGRSLRSAVAGDFAGREAMSLGPIYCRYGLLQRRSWHCSSIAHPLSACYDIPSW